MATTNKLPLDFTSARIEAPRPGATTWHRGVRCTVVDSNLTDLAHPMVRVAFADGRIAILKLSEIGLRRDARIAPGEV